MTSPTDDRLDWRGETLVDRDGDTIGRIADIHLDRQSGEPRWLAVKTGHFGSKLRFVPIGEATARDGGIVVPYDKASVKDAPGAEDDGGLSAEEERRLDRHYGSELAGARRATAEDDADRHRDGDRDGDAPEGPTKLGGRSWLATLKRAGSEFSEDNGTDWAAALTYYAVLSLFPALIALVGLVGLVMDPQTLTRYITDTVSQLGPASAVETFQGPIESIASNSGTGLVMLVVGVLGALWSASGYVGGFMRASNAMYEVPEGRAIWKLRPLQMLVTLVILLLVALVFVALIVSGPLAEAIGEAIGLGSAAVTAYQIAKWPIMALLVIGILAVLYYSAPNARLPKFRWITPGAVFALVIWVLASAAFAFYVANFGSYNKTYGTLGGVVAFLVWMWITNLAVLFGQELNAELERSRELEAGDHRAERRIQLPRRDEPKPKQMPDTAHGAHPAPEETRTR